MSPGVGASRVFRVQTQCTEAELVDKLAPYCGDDSLALPGAVGLAVGAVTRFCVTLSGGQAALSGSVQVLSLRAHSAEPERTIVRAKVLDLDDGCRPFWAALLQRRRPTRASALPAPPGAPGNRPPPALPAMDPSENAFSGFIREASFGEEGPAGFHQDDPTVLAPTSEADLLASVAPLATPVRLAATPTRTTGKAAAYAPKASTIMVARKSAWPPWAQTLGKALAARRDQAWSAIPQGARPSVARYAPSTAFWVFGLLCGLWWSNPAPVMVAAKTAVAAPALIVPNVTTPRPTVHRQIYDHCSVRINTQPASAMVSWGESPLGETPLQDVAVPCGRALVSVRLAGYTPIVITMTATLDGPVVFSGVMKLPEPDEPARSPVKSARRRR